jgi:hypothetical protein
LRPKRGEPLTACTKNNLGLPILDLIRTEPRWTLAKIDDNFLFWWALQAAFFCFVVSDMSFGLHFFVGSVRVDGDLEFEF